MTALAEWLMYPDPQTGLTAWALIAVALIGIALATNGQGGGGRGR